MLALTLRQQRGGTVGGIIHCVTAAQQIHMMASQKLPRLWLVKKILSNKDTERNIGLVLGRAENYFSSRIFYYGHSLESHRKRHPVQSNYIH